MGIVALFEIGLGLTISRATYCFLLLRHRIMIGGRCVAMTELFLVPKDHQFSLNLKHNQRRMFCSDYKKCMFLYFIFHHWIRMGLQMPFAAWFLFLIWQLMSPENSAAQQPDALYISNKCPFPIWPATAPNTGYLAIADGGFSLPSGQTRRIHVPPTWSGRIWGRTGCKFRSNAQPSACQTGDCEGRLACNGTIGLPPATLVQISLQADKSKPSFYDVSLVDGYNLPVLVTTKAKTPNCSIGGCLKNLNGMCPQELQVVGDNGKEVVACKSACLAFDVDMFCCRNEYGSPEKCKPSVYSKMFKEACPSYFSYAYDTPPPLVNCPSKDYVITFCPSKWGDDHAPI